MKSRKGFSLVELLVVVAILVVIAAAVVSVISNAPEQARQQFTTETMIKLKTALLDFRDDMGGFPSEGVMFPDASEPTGQTRAIAQGIDVIRSLNPDTTTPPTYLIGSIAAPNNGFNNENAHFSWSDDQIIPVAPAGVELIVSNFWMLFQRPYPKDWGDIDLAGDADYEYQPDYHRFNKVTRLGWEGPYVKDDRGGFFYPEGSAFGNQFAIPDEYINGPYSESWFKVDSGNGVDSRRLRLGAPILLIKDTGTPTRPAKGYYLLSAGPNGSYDFDKDSNPDGSDDIEVFVSPL